jgi:hypothetical protein
MAAAIPLAIEVAARPNDPNEPIPRKKMVAEDKLKAEGGLSEMKTILGWLFNFRTLTVSLPEHKYIAWSKADDSIPTNDEKAARINDWTPRARRLHHPLGLSLIESIKDPSFSSRENAINQN